jgi:hypothetical protein
MMLSSNDIGIVANVCTWVRAVLNAPLQMSAVPRAFSGGVVDEVSRDAVTRSAVFVVAAVANCYELCRSGRYASYSCVYAARAQLSNSSSPMPP